METLLAEDVLLEDMLQLEEVRHVDKFRLFTTKDTKLYIPIRGYSVFLLLEHGDIASTYVQNLPLMRRLLYAYTPKVKRTYNKILKTDIKKVKSNYGDRITLYFNVKLFENKSFYYDITPYVDYLHTKLSYIRFVDVGANFIKSCIEEVKDINEHKILLYIVDPNILPTKLREREMYAYLFSRRLMKGTYDLDFEKIFMVVMNPDKYVRLIYDRSLGEKNKYNIFMRYIKQAVKSRTELVTDEEIAEEEPELEIEPEPVIITAPVTVTKKPEPEPVVKPTVSKPSKEKPEKKVTKVEPEPITKEKPEKKASKPVKKKPVKQEEEIDISVSASEVDKMADELVKNTLNTLGSLNLSYSVLKNRVAMYIKSDDTITKVATQAYNTSDVSAQTNIVQAALTPSEDPRISLIMPDVAKDVHKQEEVAEDLKLTTTVPVDNIHKGEVEKYAIGNNFAHPIVRRMDYKAKLIKDIKEAARIPLGEIGFTIKKIYFSDWKSPDTEINKTQLEYINIQCVKDNGETATLKFLIPKLTEDRYVVSGGLKWYFPTIMSTVPIFIIKPGICQFRSNYSSIQFHHGIFNRREDIKCYIGGYKIPLALLLSYLITVEGVLQHFKFQYMITDKKPRQADTVKLPMADGKYLIVKEKSGDIERCILNGLTLMFKAYKPNNINTKHEAIEALKAFTKEPKSEYIFSQIQKYIIDVQTMDILVVHNLPTKLFDICIYCAEKAASRVTEDKLSINQLYLRTMDIITTAIEKGVHTAVAAYRQQRIYSPTKQLTSDKAFVINFFRENGVLQLLEQQNPLEELTAYTTVKIVGPGGLPNKEAVQPKDRALRMDHFGNIDPVDTPEGDPGTKLQLTSGHLYDRNLASFVPMNPNKNDKYILGPSASFTPFVEKDDQGRVILSSNQNRQALPLEQTEVPLVATGIESKVAPLLSSTFTKKADNDGVVEYIDENVIVVKLNNGKYQVVDIRPQALKSGSGMDAAITYEPTVKVGQKVKKFQILTVNQFIKPTMAQGLNAKACFLSYLGYNYEDGIVVSESFAKKLTSLHYDTIDINLNVNDNINVFPQIGQSFSTGETIVSIRKNIVGEIELGEEYSVTAPTDVTVVDIEVYPIDVGHVKPIIDQIDSYYKKTNQQLKKIGLPPLFDKTKVIANAGAYTESGKKLTNTKIIIKLLRKMSASLGDKVTNRHSAKGVITHIVPDNLMPETVETKEKMDIIINALSVISRMNLGQLYELSLGNVLYQATNKLKDMISSNKSRNDIEEFLIKLYEILDATEDKYYSASIAKSLRSFSNDNFKKAIDSLAKNGIRFIAAPFNSPSADQIEEAAKFLNIKLMERMRLPEIDSKCVTKKEVAWGVMYIQKLEHISELKEHARNVGPYIKTTLEPTRGKSRAGGQRLGELDTWCILAYDAHTVLRDLMAVSGDNPDAKRKVLSDIYSKGSADVDPKELSRSGAGQMLDAILIAMGIDPSA